MGEGQRERHRIGSRLQALSHQPRARRGARTQGPRDRDLAEVGRLTDCATQAPLVFVYVNCLFMSFVHFYMGEVHLRESGGKFKNSACWGRLGGAVG